MAEKRSIFEEVDSRDAVKPVPQGGMIDRGRSGARGAVRLWMVVLAVLVMAMIVVGGLTRLTDSGLSITEWKPITGAIPPLNQADWEAEFALYQAIPEFQIQNRWMELEDFKFIYWWEWGHRQLGRFVGLVWAVGFLFFWLTRRIPAGWTTRMILPGLLGGVQGGIGWWMVYSGLSGSMTDVASYRLATHLGLAFIILGFLVWYILSLGRPERELMQARRLREARLFGLSTGWLHFTVLQILLGALVAGIDAGRSYTDWPLMGGQVVPRGIMVMEPWWRNFFENPGLVQFIHRVVGYLLVAYTVMAWMRGRNSANRTTQVAFSAAAIAVAAQIGLGIYTVVTAAPWQVAILHQIGAIVAFILILRARFLSQYPVTSSIRGA
ncbi:MAG: heme A synthase [Rhodobacterales bacterium]|nr:MAG: heme A synthase [Rhodobacterales bacterium]